MRSSFATAKDKNSNTMKQVFTVLMIVFATVSFAQVDGNNGSTRDGHSTWPDGVQQIDYQASIKAFVIDGQLIMVSNLSDAFESFSVFNIQGTLITTQVANSTREMIDVSNYVPGVYFVQAEIDNQQVVKKVFISGR